MNHLLVWTTTQTRGHVDTWTLILIWMVYYSTMWVNPHTIASSFFEKRLSHPNWNDFLHQDSMTHYYSIDILVSDFVRAVTKSNSALSSREIARHQTVQMPLLRVLLRILMFNISWSGHCWSCSVAWFVWFCLSFTYLNMGMLHYTHQNYSFIILWIIS
jgi:hypothetical protein